ncbi:hypothetical protein [Pseudoalteromonas luteoviolacea]|uniref:hypothetical protein n=1 Tax=Pseudoalteromonas luteoviolacea TaxID=43657 RepID=UPI00114F1E59|nr:hypothetical protein [Pseudoalteromonas luteoviolacea]TQF70297.1 hypothetical protein FLM44_04175 [Pseudoalteromonas luteoviolacea]
MRKILLASLVGLLTACGGGSGSSSNDDQRPPTQNRAPTVTLSGNTLAISAESITLNTAFNDPDNDQLTVNWSSSLTGVQFDQASLATTIVKFPTVTEKQNITLTCEVSDGVNPAVTKTYSITLYPVIAGANIVMEDSYAFSSGSTATINATFETDTEIQDVMWEFEGIDLSYEASGSTTHNKGESTLKIELPDVSEVTEFKVTLKVVTDNGAHTRSATMKVSPADGPTLSVSLPEQITVSSAKEASIVPTIAHSDEIESYSWQWQQSPQPSEQTSSNKVYKFVAPVVAQDTTFDLSLKVTMKGGVTETATTKVNVKKQVTQNPITLTSSHDVAASGQTVVVTSNVTDFSDVESVTWSVNNQFDDQYLTKENSKLTIQVPEVESYNNFHNISYTVKYKSGGSVTETQPFTFHNTVATRGAIDIINKDQRFDIYPKREVTHNYNLTSAVPIDDIRIVAITNLHTYDILEVSHDNNTATVKVLDNEYLASSFRAFDLIIKAGFAEKEIKVYAESYNSLLRTYAGVNETYVSGSNFYLFGQLNHLEGNTDYVPAWDNSGGVSKVSNDVALFTEYRQILPQNDEARLSLYTRDEADTFVTNSAQITLAKNLEVEGEHYRCTVEDTALSKCTSSNSLLNFETQPDQLKQVVTRGYYACQLGNAGDVHCAGFNDSPVAQVPTLENVVKLNAVNYDTACAQFANASWQCWGSAAASIEQLIAQSGLVHQILGNHTHTCLVSDGNLVCYAGNEVVFQSTGDYIENIVLDDGELCYRTQGSNILNCPMKD